MCLTPSRHPSEGWDPAWVEVRCLWQSGMPAFAGMTRVGKTNDHNFLNGLQTIKAGEGARFSLYGKKSIDPEGAHVIVQHDGDHGDVTFLDDVEVGASGIEVHQQFR
jgi:hypothetical protein